MSVGVRRCSGVCKRMRGCARMNFQNFFWRIVSLNQRTLIHILYEFFSSRLSSRFSDLILRWGYKYHDNSDKGEKNKRSLWDTVGLFLEKNS